MQYTSIATRRCEEHAVIARCHPSRWGPGGEGLQRHSRVWMACVLSMLSGVRGLRSEPDRTVPHTSTPAQRRRQHVVIARCHPSCCGRVGRGYSGTTRLMCMVVLRSIVVRCARTVESNHLVPRKMVLSEKKHRKNYEIDVSERRNNRRKLKNKFRPGLIIVPDFRRTLFSFHLVWPRFTAKGHEEPVPDSHGFR